MTCDIMVFICQPFQNQYRDIYLPTNWLLIRLKGPAEQKMDRFTDWHAKQIISEPGLNRKTHKAALLAKRGKTWNSKKCLSSLSELRESLTSTETWQTISKLHKILTRLQFSILCSISEHDSDVRLLCMSSKSPDCPGSESCDNVNNRQGAVSEMPNSENKTQVFTWWTWKVAKM